MKRLLLLLFLFQMRAYAQQQVHPADTIPVTITATPDSAKEAGLVFQAETRELRGIAGAPKPFYTYFWEFGDGNFSFQKQPDHVYAEAGNYDVRVYATNNYDDGKPPPIKPKSISAKGRQSMMAAASPNIFNDHENLSLRVNRMPRPGEEMVLIVAYRNQAGWVANELDGRIALFYNEKQFGKDNFKLEDTRTYHGEKAMDEPGSLAYAASEIMVEDAKHRGGDVTARQIPVESAASAIRARQEMYRDGNYFSFTGLKAEEARYIFVSFRTTPEMLQDTNAVITLSAVFIPDGPSIQTEVADLELQIVASHDPNKMMLRHRFMNYRFTGRKRKLDYKVRFQNTGEGPARQIKITVKTPSVADNSKLIVVGMSPQCIPCRDAYVGQSCLDTLIFKDSIQFLFRNIYLPGVQQDGVNNLDSTKGFIAYQIGFKNKPEKRPFFSSAAIVFDKNEPIKTNRSAGRFLPGISPGIIAMYGLQLAHAPTVKLGSRDFNIGFSISPYSPYRKYLQAEFYLGGFSEFKSPVVRTNDREVFIHGQWYKSAYQDSFTLSRQLNINLVPVQLRYNINKYVGVGVGPMVSVDIQSTNKNVYQALVMTAQGQESLLEESQVEKKAFNNFRASFFADLQLGLVRAGPAAGIRLFHGLEGKQSRLAFYLTWKL